MNNCMYDYISQDFVWGANDCATMVGRYYRDKYNIKIVDDFINKYNSSYGAYKAYLKAGGYVGILKNNFVKVEKNYSRADDICIMFVKNKKMPIWGIVSHSRRVAFAGGATLSINNINGEYYRYEKRN